MSSPSKSLISQITTRSSVSTKTVNPAPSNSDIMKLLRNFQSTQSDILISNKHLADTQIVQFTDLKKCLEGLTKQVADFKLENTILHNKINLLETRLAPTEKFLSDTALSSSTSFSANAPSCAKNIIIRGVLKSLEPSASKCNRLSKIDYQTCIKNTQEMLLHKPAIFWKCTRELNFSASIPSTVHLNNESAYTPLDSAALFSKYFSSVYNSLPPFSTHISNYNTYSYALPSNCYFNIDDVYIALSNLKNNFSNGLDEISARLLYNCRDFIVFPLFHIFKRSLDEGVFPDVWKTS
jgi:hypothetical protein